MAHKQRFEVPGFDRFGKHADPRLDRRVPRLYGPLLTIAACGIFAVAVLVVLLVRIAVG
jgi:hypothetical protein